MELIHIDLSGPIDPSTWDNKKYMLTFIDDYTHFTIVYLLKNKYEVTETIKEYAERVETKWNSRISQIRSDNEPEVRIR